MKRVLAALIVLGLLGVGGYVLYSVLKKPQPRQPEVARGLVTQETIGTSVEGRPITAYTYGQGSTTVLFVGGIHGGYEWNSVLVAYELMDYLDHVTDAIPTELTIQIIPMLNPDGVFRVVGKEGRFSYHDVTATKAESIPGRFNARGVDLNRNFDCKWKPESMWQNKKVSAGSVPFSEPEAAALRDFVLATKPASVVFWHSQANAVYASECTKGILPETLVIMNAYAKAAGYQAVTSFDAYPVSGDAEGWLASINIPAISVELKTHETIEWEQNLAGIKALFEHYRGK